MSSIKTDDSIKKIISLFYQIEDEADFLEAVCGSESSITEKEAILVWQSLTCLLELERA